MLCRQGRTGRKVEKVDKVDKVDGFTLMNQRRWVASRKSLGMAKAVAVKVGWKMEKSISYVEEDKLKRMPRRTRGKTKVEITTEGRSYGRQALPRGNFHALIMRMAFSHLGIMSGRVYLFYG